MTRKDYIAIANALRGAYPGANADYSRSFQFAADAAAVCKALASVDPHFDAEQFRVACGLGRTLLAHAT